MKTSPFTSALLTITLLLSLTISQFGCKSTPGEVGPAGATGATGATGPAGPQGPTGTANVTQISFGSRTHSGIELSYTLTGITSDMISKSSVFAYIKSSQGYWYPIPGLFAGGTNEYRMYMMPGTTDSKMQVTRVGSSSSTDTFAATRVLIIPAATLVNGRKAAPDVDFTNYLAVKQYYHLAD